MKKLLLAAVAIFVLLLLNQCTDPHWFNGGNGWPDTFLGKLFS